MTSFFKRIFNKIYRHRDMVAFCRSSGMKVGEHCRIAHSVNIGTEPYLISIGRHCEITADVNLITHDGGVWVFREEYPKWDIMGHIVIEDNVYIGYGAVVLPGVRVGAGSVIGSRAVVTKDIPSGVVAVGVPARVIKTTEEYFKKCRDVAIDSKGLFGAEKREFVVRALSAQKS